MASRPLPAIADLWLRPDVTLQEAARMTGRSYETLTEWKRTDQVRWFVDGKYIRIVTKSLFERSERMAAEQSGVAA